MAETFGDFFQKTIQNAKTGVQDLWNKVTTPTAQSYPKPASAKPVSFNSAQQLADYAMKQGKTKGESWWDSSPYKVEAYKLIQQRNGQKATPQINTGFKPVDTVANTILNVPQVQQGINSFGQNETVRKFAAPLQTIYKAVTTPDKPIQPNPQITGAFRGMVAGEKAGKFQDFKNLPGSQIGMPQKQLSPIEQEQNFRSMNAQEQERYTANERQMWMDQSKNLLSGLVTGIFGQDTLLKKSVDTISDLATAPVVGGVYDLSKAGNIMTGRVKSDRPILDFLSNLTSGAFATAPNPALQAFNIILRTKPAEETFKAYQNATNIPISEQDSDIAATGKSILNFGINMLPFLITHKLISGPSAKTGAEQTGVQVAKQGKFTMEDLVTRAKVEAQTDPSLFKKVQTRGDAIEVGAKSLARDIVDQFRGMVGKLFEGAEEVSVPKRLSNILKNPDNFINSFAKGVRTKAETSLYSANPFLPVTRTLGELLRFDKKTDSIPFLRFGEGVGRLMTTPQEIGTALQGDKKKPSITDMGVSVPSAPEPFQDSGKLTTKILDRLQNKTVVSKQYIADLAKQQDVQQVEKNIINGLLEKEPNMINVEQFASKVKSELLPLERKNTSIDFPDRTGEPGKITQYDNISLPDDIKGDVADYSENIYQSPIATEVGSIHYKLGDNPNYFGHTRIEDMADGTTRRVIEVQSDLYQKGNLDKELNSILNEAPGFEYYKDKRAKEIEPLRQYKDPTAHFRMIREELKKASKDGKNTVLFPTGDTAMKIEGLGEQNTWRIDMPEDYITSQEIAKPSDLKVGLEITDPAYKRWVVTEVFGDGKFMAVPQNTYVEGVKKYDNAETFDISGKMDTNNPIHKFYESEVGKYLKNNYVAEPFTDDKGVTWWKVDLKNPKVKASTDKPVFAFKTGANSELTPGDISEQARVSAEQQQPAIQDSMLSDNSGSNNTEPETPITAQDFLSDPQGAVKAIEQIEAIRGSRDVPLLPAPSPSNETGFVLKKGATNQSGNVSQEALRAKAILRESGTTTPTGLDPIELNPPERLALPAPKYEAAAFDKVMEEGRRPIVKQEGDKMLGFKTAWHDDLAPLLQIEEGKSPNAYLAATLHKTAPLEIIHEGIADLNKIYAGIPKDLQKTFDEIQVLSMLEARSKQGLQNPENITQITVAQRRADLESRLSSEAKKVLNEGINSVREWSKEYLMDYLIKNKRISEETAKLWQEKYPDHFPIQVIHYLEEMGVGDFGGSNVMPVKEIKQLKKAEGTKSIFDTDTLRARQRRLAQIVMAVEKDKVASEILSDFGEEVKDKDITVEKFRAQNKGMDMITDTQGKRYSVPLTVAEVMRGMNKEDLDVITKTVSALTGIMRSGATSGRIAFSLFTNPLRDPQQIKQLFSSVPGVLNKYSFTADLIPSVIRAFLHVSGIKEDALVKELAERGGAMGGFVTQDRINLRDQELTPFVRKTLPQKIRSLLSYNPVGLLYKGTKLVAESLEVAARRSAAARFGKLSEDDQKRILKALNPKYEFLVGNVDPKDLQAFIMRRATTDFRQIGNKMRPVNNILLFTNAAEKGASFKYGQLKNTPLSAMKGIIKYALITTALSIAWNESHGGDKDIDPYTKSKFFVFKTGINVKDEEGVDTPLVIAIPKGENQLDWSNILQSSYDIATSGDTQTAEQSFPVLMGMAQPFYKKDTDIGKMMTPAMVQAANLLRVPIATSMFEILANYDLYRQRKIVPTSKEGLSAKNQTNTYTPDIIKWAGEQMNVSPAKLDFFLSGLYPAYKQYVNAPALFKAKSDKDFYSQFQSYVPILRTVYKSDPEVEKAYEAKNKADTENKDQNFQIRTEMEDIMKKGGTDQDLIDYIKKLPPDKREYGKTKRKDLLSSSDKSQLDLVVSDMTGKEAIEYYRDELDQIKESGDSTKLKEILDSVDSKTAKQEIARYVNSSGSSKTPASPGQVDFSKFSDDTVRKYAQTEKQKAIADPSYRETLLNRIRNISDPVQKARVSKIIIEEFKQQ